MERWIGKVALVTGASAGIGAATVEILVKEGLTVVGVARRVEKIQEIGEKVKGAKGKLYARKCDVSKEEEILETFAWIKENLGGVDVLINNAGMLKPETLSEGSTDGFRRTLDVNVLGVAVATREAVQSMKERNFDGHIININSVLGHYINVIADFYNIYPASKYAVTAMTETVRKELILAKSKIKITSISPGVVSTDFFTSAQEQLGKEWDSLAIESHPALSPEDIANAIVYVLGTPPHVQVCELLIRPVGEVIA